MTKGVITVPVNATVRNAAKLMSEKHLGSLVVVRGKEAVGIITERDVLRVVSEGLNLKRTKVSDIMSTPIIAINEDATIYDAVKVMGEKKIKKLPVLSKKRLVGIITLTDFARVEPKISEILAKFIAEKEIPQRFEKYLKPKIEYIV
jgi:CBS domain-containing protein